MSKDKLIHPYLNFDGKCDEALAFYERALGAEVGMVMRYKDSPEPPPPGCGPMDPGKVMHVEFRVGESVIMASDGHGGGNPKFEGIALTLLVPTEAEAERAFNALEKGGKVEMPLAKTFFSPRFGMVSDQFGVRWMVLTPKPEAKDHPAGKETRRQFADAK